MDVEASGPVPNHGDMISFAAIVIEPNFVRQFDSGNMRPECDRFNEGAYKAIGMTREQHLAAPYSIEERMLAFDQWLKDEVPSPNARYIMVSDNPGFDFMWMAFESWNKLDYSPLGHSARRIGDAYAGLKGSMRNTQGWKKYRRAPHDHTPLNDALGNAQAWEYIWNRGQTS